jgi:rubrerythrin
MGSASGPHGGAVFADTGMSLDSEHSRITENPHMAKSRRESGSTLRQYQCPVCGYAWSGAPSAATDSS